MSWKGYKKPKETEWDSGLNIIEEPTIELEHSLLTLCNKIQEKLPRTEFSILCKGYETNNGFYVSGEYVIPKQKVTGSTIDYEPLDKYQEEGYNVVIHSHHELGSFFSQTDSDYINCNFPCSVLYTKRNFTIGTLSFHRGESIFVINVDDIQTITSDINEIIGFENIEKKNTYQYKKGKSFKKQVKLQKNEKEKKRDCYVCSYIENEPCQHCFSDDFIDYSDFEKYDTEMNR